MKKISLSILIPAYNDADTITNVIRKSDETARKITSEYEIRVINDSSLDDTGQVLSGLLKSYKKLVISTHAVNQGYGGAIRDLYLTGKYDWEFTVPGDGQIDPGELLKLIPYIDQADMILGRRVNRHDPEARLRQSKIYNMILRILYGLDIHDVNTVRLMKREIIKSIELSTTSAFVDAELAIDASRAGYKIMEVPIDHKRRTDEEGAGGGSMKTILPTIRDMFLYRLRY